MHDSGLLGAGASQQRLCDQLPLRSQRPDAAWLTLGRRQLPQAGLPQPWGRPAQEATTRTFVLHQDHLSLPLSERGKLERHRGCRQLDRPRSRLVREGRDRKQRRGEMNPRRGPCRRFELSRECGRAAQAHSLERDAQAERARVGGRERHRCMLGGHTSHARGGRRRGRYRACVM